MLILPSYLSSELSKIKFGMVLHLAYVPKTLKKGQYSCSVYKVVMGKVWHSLFCNSKKKQILKLLKYSLFQLVHISSVKVVEFLDCYL